MKPSEVWGFIFHRVAGARVHHRNSNILAIDRPSREMPYPARTTPVFRLHPSFPRPTRLLVRRLHKTDRSPRLPAGRRRRPNAQLHQRRGGGRTLETQQELTTRCSWTDTRQRSPWGCPLGVESARAESHPSVISSTFVAGSTGKTRLRRSPRRRTACTARNTAGLSTTTAREQRHTMMRIRLPARGASTACEQTEGALYQPYVVTRNPIVAEGPRYNVATPGSLRRGVWTSPTTRSWVIGRSARSRSPHRHGIADTSCHDPFDEIGDRAPIACAHDRRSKPAQHTAAWVGGGRKRAPGPKAMDQEHANRYQGTLRAKAEGRCMWAKREVLPLLIQGCARVPLVGCREGDGLIVPLLALGVVSACHSDTRPYQPDVTSPVPAAHHACPSVLSLM